MKLSVSTLIITFMAIFASSSGAVDDEQSNNLRGDISIAARRELAPAAAPVAAPAAAPVAADADSPSAPTTEDAPTTTTIQDRTKEYVVSHAQTSYSDIPAEWDRDQWIFFAIAMFVFGGFSSLCCLLFVLPCCCPNVMKTAYARCIAPQHMEESLIRN
mmetsp:Transcript_20462/g.30388  ORF Transcript_20462/g.30388 Transcript_20462/m.30388 type:complete len:159 (+) Transcript_20462:213-689(+)